MLQQLKTSNQLPFFRSLRGKLLLWFLGVSITPLMAVGILTYNQSKIVLQDEAAAKLTAIRDIKTAQVETYFQNALADVTVLSKSPAVISAMKSLNRAAEMEAKGTGRDEAVALKKYQDLYLDNPDMVDAGDGSVYSVAHAKYHELFREYQQDYGYYDIFLVEPDAGTIVYSVFKKEDFGTGLLKGPYASTNLGAVFGAAVKAEDGNNTVVLQDFAYYEPTKDVAAFAASPIFDRSTLIGVLIFQLPITQISEMMQESTGLGETGETILVGADDRLLRSDSRFSAASTILRQMSQALGSDASETSFDSITDYRGNEVFIAYTPVNLNGVHWRVEAKIDKAEALAPAGFIFRRIMLMVGLSILLVTAVAFFVAYGITAPLAAATDIARKLAIGNIDQQISIRNRNETGVMAEAFSQLITYIKEMATFAARLAEGDLTVEVEIRSEKDVLGAAFGQMAQSLRQLTAQVVENAGQMTMASRQLTDIAGQAGGATEQAVERIQRVSLGINRQTQQLEHVSLIVRQLTNAIDGVAQGAQEQATAAGKTSHITGELMSNINQMTANAQAGADGSRQSAKIAHGGQQTVQQTVAGMVNIKAAFEELTEKIQEMGRRSEQVGMIVETIDDIASQTNLLALNAAIEAARAGEHGKGFAVVADEVRKLAEKSAAATGEISRLIENIQQTTNAAEKSMKHGVELVNTGMENAHQAGEALQHILQSAEEVKLQVEEVSRATGSMEHSSRDLVDAIDTVSAVIEENTAATEEMAAGSAEALQAIQDIVLVSEENNLAVADVGSAAEEMSAQVQEVLASAQALNQLADQLTVTVSIFKLGNEEDIINQLNMFKYAHIRWVERIEEMLAGRLTLQEDEIDLPTACILGQWYYQAGAEQYGDRPEFIAIEEPHRQLHQAGRAAVVACNQGDHQQAETLLQQAAQNSADIVSALDGLAEYITSS